MAHSSGTAVLVIGAGLSAPAGMPVQRDLLRRMYESPSDFSTDSAISYLTPPEIEGRDKVIGVSYYEGMQKVREFIEQVFEPIVCSSRPWHQVSLEDVYSILDRAIHDGDSLPPYSSNGLSKIRQALDSCLVRYLRRKVEAADYSIYQKLYSCLKDRYPQGWTTISTNWDMIWDRTLASCSGIQVSYGADLYGLGDEPIGAYYPIPGEGHGHRILKVHGSLDWLICPCCHSVFVSDQAAGVPCPRCGASDSPGREPLLRNSLLTPSMLKVLSNPTMRIILDEAFHALRAATEAVFVGYSLPEADHDLRYLFRRGIRSSCKISVVFLGPMSDPIVERYRQLFGIDESCFACEGFQEYYSL